MTLVLANNMMAEQKETKLALLPKNLQSELPGVAKETWPAYRLEARRNMLTEELEFKKYVKLPKKGDF